MAQSAERSLFVRPNRTKRLTPFGGATVPDDLRTLPASVARGAGSACRFCRLAGFVAWTLAQTTTGDTTMLPLAKEQRRRLGKIYLIVARCRCEGVWIPTLGRGCHARTHHERGSSARRMTPASLGNVRGPSFPAKMESPATVFPHATNSPTPVPPRPASARQGRSATSRPMRARPPATDA